MVAYINAYKNLFGVEPICRVLRCSPFLVQVKG